MIYPPTLTQDLRDALNPTSEYVRKLATLFRRNGHAVGDTEKLERVFVIDQHIRLVCTHGAAWDVAAIALYKQLMKDAK